MNLGQVTNLDKRNKTVSKNFDGNVISANCDVIAVFPICGKFGAIRKSDFGCLVGKTYINSNLLSYKSSKQN